MSGSAGTGRFTAGDPLRALAALGVLVAHAVGPQVERFDGAFGTVSRHVVVSSQVAVNVFFVLSGYLISRPFIRAYLGSGPFPSPGRYLRRRALRILPAYWVVFTLFLTLFGLGAASPSDLLGSYLLLQPTFLIPWNPFLIPIWTVVVEAGFYLLVPLATVSLMAIGRRVSHRHRIVLLGSALGLAWCLSALRHHPGPNTGQAHIAAFLWSFVPGIALAVVEQVSSPAWTRRADARLLPAALLALAVLSFGVLTVTYAEHSDGGWIGIIPLLTVTSGAVVAAPLVLQWSGRSCWRWLDNQPLHWIGRRSYGLYLIHTAVAFKLVRLIPSAVPRWPTLALSLVATLAVSLALSHVLYELVESQFADGYLLGPRAVRATSRTA